jgi:hypothetical protein
MLHQSLLLIALYCLLSCCFSFQSNGIFRKQSLQLSSSKTVEINGKVISATLLKSLQLTNADGKKAKVGDLTGNGKSVVVFLRHLG